MLSASRSPAEEPSSSVRRARAWWRPRQIDGSSANSSARPASAHADHILPSNVGRLCGGSGAERTGRRPSRRGRASVELWRALGQTVRRSAARRARHGLLEPPRPRSWELLAAKRRSQSSLNGSERWTGRDSLQSGARREFTGTLAGEVMSSGVTPARKCSRGDARCGARLGADLPEDGATTVLSRRSTSPPPTSACSTTAVGTPTCIPTAPLADRRPGMTPATPWHTC